MERPNNESPKFLWLCRVPWILMGLFAASPLTFVINEYQRQHVIDRYSLFAATLVVLLSIAGLLLRWGPTLPCMFLGMIVGPMFLIQPMTHTYEERVYSLYVPPIIGAICGAAFGMLLDVSNPLGAAPPLPRRFSLRTASIALTIASLLLGLLAILLGR